MNTISILEDMSLSELIERSIRIVQENVPKDAVYHGCFSGGKDSVVLKRIVELAGVPATWNYNVTGIDPPELIHFIKKFHPDVNWLFPTVPFFKKLVDKGFPDRRGRWCCDLYKEKGNPVGAYLLLGVRAEESPKRAETGAEVRMHHKTGKPAVSPIFWWGSDDVWSFIRSELLPYCSLYDEGFHRLGCIGCPVASKQSRLREFARWPRYEKLWKNAFRKRWERMAFTIQSNGLKWFGTDTFDSWEEMWQWWLNDELLPARRTGRSIAENTIAIPS